MRVPGRGDGKCKGPEASGEFGMTESKAIGSWVPPEGFWVSL